MICIFFRCLLKVPKSTPKEMLFLELGCVPLREIVRKRRLLYLKHIFNEDPNSILYKFLRVQMENRKSKDWVTQVLKDITELKLNLSIEDIKEMKKSKLKVILNKSINEKAFEDLVKKRENHSKVINMKHKKLEMQRYLKSNGLKIKQEEVI